MSPVRDYSIVIVGRGELADPTLHAHLRAHYAVHSVQRMADVAQRVLDRAPDAVVSEQHLEDGDGVDLLQRMRFRYPHAVRVLLLQSAQRDDVVRAINDAAVYQVVSPPFEPEQLTLVLKRALESRELSRLHRHLSRELKLADDVLRDENAHMTRTLQQAYRFDAMVFVSDAMAEVCNTARKAALTDLPVLIEGETGTGKELVAKAIHHAGSRSQQPFVDLNCGALSDDLLLCELFGHSRGGAIGDRPGLCVEADRGTLFLDEIADLSPAVQVALLRFMQDGEVRSIGSEHVRQADVRIIAATHRPLLPLVEAGRFRRDLYYRLKGFEIAIPPLRDRPEDIPVLTDHLIRKYAAVFGRRISGVASQAQYKLRTYAFPGNVRELDNEIRRTVVLLEDGEFITLQHLSAEIVRARPRPDRLAMQPVALDGQTLKARVEQLEAALVRAALERHQGNHTRAADELGISRMGLANKARRYGVDRPLRMEAH